MAEKSAHLSSTVQNRPSIFEIIAQESLNGLLSPAFKRVSDILSFRYPQHLYFLKYFDETWLVLNSILQYSYLKRCGSTFSENFYGLKRVPLHSNDSAINLPKKELILSLLMTSVYPYIKSKLEKRLAMYQLEDIPVRKTDVLNVNTKFALLNGAHMLIETAVFVQRLLYLSGHSDINSPLLLLAGVKLQYSTDPEEQAVFRWNSKEMLQNVMRRSLEFTAFFLQFLQYWQKENVTSLDRIPIPEPPVRNKDITNVCPICKNKRKIDTVLSVSGYIFCFECISEHLSEASFCPVTNLPATLEHLVRIYPPAGR